MSENKRDYAVGRGKPPLHTRFKKGQSGKQRGPRRKNLPARLIEASRAKGTAGALSHPDQRHLIFWTEKADL